MTSVLKNVSSCRVSSVLNKDVKNFGKQCLFDEREDTCWNSEKGLPQWIRLDFTEPATFSTLRIQFQGGFAGRDCKIKIKTSEDDVVKPFYPEDNNLMQSFPLGEQHSANQVTIVFETSTDFFGRIIIYTIDLVR